VQFQCCGEEVQNVSGSGGTGKSHLAQAIGHAAIHQGYKVLYRETHTLLDELAESVADGTRSEYSFARNGAAADRRFRHAQTAAYRGGGSAGDHNAPLRTIQHAVDF